MIRLHLFPVTRRVPAGAEHHEVASFADHKVYRTVLRTKEVKIPWFVFELGPMFSAAAWGLFVAWGVEARIGEGYRIRPHSLELRLVDYVDRVVSPWLWWSPIKPIFWQSNASSRAWTGRDRELVGLHIKWGRQRLVHWLRTPL